MSIDKNKIILSDAARKKFDKLRNDTEKYNGLSDAELAYRIHRDFYSHIQNDAFIQSLSRPSLHNDDSTLQNNKAAAVQRNSTNDVASKNKWSNPATSGIVAAATVLALFIFDNDFSRKSDDTNFTTQKKDPIGDETQSPPTASPSDGESAGVDGITTTEPSQREPPDAPSPEEDPSPERAHPLAVDSAPSDERPSVADAPSAKENPSAERAQPLAVDSATTERPSVADALPTCPDDRESTWTECFGELSYPDGRVYRGEWRDDQLNGEGEMIWPDGRLYSGAFKDDMRHGQGVMRYPNKTSQSGLWENDKYVPN
jgi:hypothetical protein